MNDLQALSNQRTQEKREMLRKGGVSMLKEPDQPEPVTEQAAHEATDAETERVLRFLHGEGNDDDDDIP